MVLRKTYVQIGICCVLAEHALRHFILPQKAFPVVLQKIRSFYHDNVLTEAEFLHILCLNGGGFIWQPQI